jgi:hypothetical protein
MSHSNTADAAPAAGAPQVPTGSRGALGATAVSGILLFVLGLANGGIEGPDVGRASTDQIRNFVAGNDAGLRAGVLVGLLTVISLVVFVAALATRIRSAAPASVLAGAVAGAGLLFAVIQLLDVAAQGMLRLLPGLIGSSSLDGIDDATVRSWYGLTGYTHFLGDLQVAPVAVVLVGMSTAALRLGLLPRWLGWTGIVLGVAAAVGVIGIALALEALYPLWFVGMIGFWLWGLALGVAAAVRWRRERRGRTPPAQPCVS